MKYLLYLMFLMGCVTAELDRGADPEESEAVSALLCPTWCVETSPTTNKLHGIWAASASDVFAVGDGGTILRRVSGTWTTMTSPTTNNLRGVFGLSSSDVWADGTGGTVVHFNGTSWSLVSGPATDLEAVWAASASDVWFTGQGSVLRWNGSSFSTVGTFTGPLLSISGTGSSDVWVTGENSGVRHWTGSSWTSNSPSVGTTSFLSVLAVAANDDWVSDWVPTKETAHWNGTSWTVVAASASGWNSMSALSSTDIWGTGSNHVGHWNGTAWSSETPPGTSPTLWSVTTRPGNAWVVGSGGLIGHRTF